MEIISRIYSQVHLKEKIDRPLEVVCQRGLPPLRKKAMLGHRSVHPALTVSIASLWLPEPSSYHITDNFTLARTSDSLRLMMGSRIHPGNLGDLPHPRKQNFVSSQHCKTKTCKLRCWTYRKRPGPVQWHSFSTRSNLQRVC